MFVRVAASSGGIGRAFATRPRVAAAIGTAAVLADLVLSSRRAASLVVRAAVAATALAALLWLARGDRASLGLRLRPTQGWRYWVLVAALAGGGILAVCSVYFAVLPEQLRLLAFMGTSIRLEGIRSTLLYSCVEWPPVEEAMYRVVLCASIAPLLGRTGTIVVGGAVFAALHFVYGSAGPDNFVAGYLFSWAYLKSESATVPLAMHAGGNLAAVLIQVGASAVVAR